MYKSPKISSFHRENLLSWFIQAEITLRNAGVTVSATKADFITEKLDLDAMQAVQDIFTTEPTNIYELVKARLI